MDDSFLIINDYFMTHPEQVQDDRTKLSEMILQSLKEDLSSTEEEIKDTSIPLAEKEVSR